MQLEGKKKKKKKKILENGSVWSGEGGFFSEKSDKTKFFLLHNFSSD